MKELSSQCRDHKKKYELYCSLHACPCCVQCVTDKHQKCQEMKPLWDILKQVKFSASVQLLEKDLTDMRTNFEEIIKYVNSRRNISNIQKTKAIEKIRSTRKSIDDFLNKIEQKILDDLETKHSKLKSEMNTLLQQLEQRANQISHLQNEFSEMTRFATELQMFIGLREIEKTSSLAAKYIEELESGDTFDEKNLEVTMSSALHSILQDVKSFGDINIITSQLTLRTKAGRKEQAQYLVITVPRIEEIKPSMLRTLTIPEDMKSINIYACRILPDGKYIILDIQYDKSHLLLFSNDGMFIRKVLTLTGSSNDACYVRNNTVAVTLVSANQTALVDIEKNEITETIEVSHFCSATASDGQILVISCRKKSTIVNLKDISHTILEGVSAHHIALFNGNIYGTIGKRVCCYKSTGKPLWTFIHNDIVNPAGLTLDRNGFVYIVSKQKNSIVVVSPDCKTCRTILSESDGIKEPYDIDIDRKTGIMIVSNKKSDDSCSYDSVIVYKI
ncbi:unnamed protein product [Mytilus coruscus]|uniref:B box-type domain-containing protein n=1 Tax=Mytilus coruscus TaxID=42192 RepID=A0A6J8ATZ8_MYTCO|nr:unnamed protein product [Mytilus coruscus]